MIFGIVFFARSASQITKIFSSKRQYDAPVFDPFLGEFIVILGSPSRSQLSEFLREAYAVEDEHRIVNSLGVLEGFGRRMKKRFLSTGNRESTIRSSFSSRFEGLNTLPSSPQKKASILSRENRRLFVVILGQLAPETEHWLIHNSHYMHPVYKEKHCLYKTSSAAAEDARYRTHITMPASDERPENNRPAGGVVYDVVTGGTSRLGADTSWAEVHKHHSRGENSIIYLEGDPTDSFDFSRTAVQHAKAIFVLPRDYPAVASQRFKSSIPTEDYVSLQIALSVKTYLSNLAQKKAVMRIEALKQYLRNFSISIT
eukprot:gb/GECG01008776.1/.p1 GENE.gb/GECG01008776.1/~~gb/GECG01008776.1/.p1  ORF type:complete len:314 (+),score=32.99 gb/GECG01008776.1/:1-942(+)